MTHIRTTSVNIENREATPLNMALHLHAPDPTPRRYSAGRGLRIAAAILCVVLLSWVGAAALVYIALGFAA